jgi:MFS transporter, AAHS family, 4-hydroxybenzoate transporter
MSVEGASTSPLQSLIDRAPITALQIRAVLLCALAFIIEGIDLGLIPLLAPSIAKAWALPISVFGTILSAGPIGLIAGGFLVGYVADRIGRRWALVGSMVLMTVATMATAWTASVPELLICRVLTGIGFGGIIPAASTLVSEFMPTRTRPSVVAFIILGQAFGAFLSTLLMKTPLLVSSDWQGIILYVSSLSAAATLVLAFTLPESPRFLLLRQPHSSRLATTLRRMRIHDMPAAPLIDSSRPDINRVRELFTGGRALGTTLLWITFIGVSVPLSFFSNWLTLIFTAAGKPVAEGINAYATYSLGAIAGGLVLPLFTARWNMNRVLMIVILAGGLASAALGSLLDRGSGVNLVLAFVCGIFVSGAFFMLYPPAVRFYPTVMRSTGIGAAVAFGRIGNWAGPASVGILLARHVAPATVFWIMGAPMIISFVALLIFHLHTADRQKLDADLPSDTGSGDSRPVSANV